METSTIKRIALIGAESTGKTTLCRSLAMRYNTLWVPEYAREFVSGNNRETSLEDIVAIAHKQLEHENEFAALANKLVFVDTEFILAKVWCEDIYLTVPSWIEEQISAHRYDLYLLTNNDLPWVPDPVRVNPQRRDYFYQLYLKELTDRQLPYEVISGRYEMRLYNATQALKKHFPELS
jgi:NadR type nicotinamide-nucleotide adenylyltransferase